MGGGFGGQKMPYVHESIPAPRNLRDLPRYLHQLLGGFFTRFAYVVKLVWHTGHWILFLLSFVALFKGLSPVIGALLSQAILNELQEIIRAGYLPESAFWGSKVCFLLIFLFVYKVLSQLINDGNRALNRIAGEKVVRQVKLQIMEKSNTLDLASFDDAAFYEKMENANREAGSRPLTILSETFGLVSTVIELVSYLIILFAAPGLAWASLLIIAVSIPSAVINFLYRRKNFQYMRSRSRERRQMNYFSGLLVDKDLVKEIRIFGLGDTFIQRYLHVFSRYYKGLRRLILGESAWHAAIGLVSAVTNLLFFAILARQVFTGRIMIGDYSLYTGAITSVAACINTLIGSSGSIYEGTLFIDNLICFLEEERRIVPRTEEASVLSRGHGHRIEFVDVSFRYPGAERDVLHKVNLHIEPGETMALVGLNGAGKTTLIKLLLRLYDPTGGKILLDGRDIRDYDLKSLYRSFGIIFQDYGKYAVSVEENIRFGDIHRQPRPGEVEQAARQSAAADYIARLPEGYDTPLTRIFEENGRELSLGQWQKLAIARAFYADADILVMDEPTASLDTIAEQEIFSQFDQLRRGKTSVFVSHRLSSATLADRIVVLENGGVVESGSHAQLMAKGGKYYELFSTQARRYGPEAA